MPDKNTYKPHPADREGKGMNKYIVTNPATTDVENETPYYGKDVSTTTSEPTTGAAKPSEPAPFDTTLRINTPTNAQSTPKITSEGEGEQVSTPTPNVQQSERQNSNTGFYDRFLQESDEERQKRERKERRAKTIAGIGDILTAFSNLYLTHRGALNTWNKGDSQAAYLDEYYRKAAEDREKQRDRYFDRYVKQQQLEAAGRKSDLALREQARKEADSEAKRKYQEEKAQIERDLAAGKIEQTEANIALTQAKQRQVEDATRIAAEKYGEWKNESAARANASNAAAENSRAAAEEHRAGADLKNRTDPNRTTGSKQNNKETKNVDLWGTENNSTKKPYNR